MGLALPLSRRATSNSPVFLFSLFSVCLFVFAICGARSGLTSTSTFTSTAAAVAAAAATDNDDDFFHGPILMDDKEEEEAKELPVSVPKPVPLH